MADKKETTAEKPEKSEKKTANPLVAAAKAIGKVAGTVASTLGVHEEAGAPSTTARPAAPKVGKLPKKNKSRLPRREKKAQRRREQASSKA